MSDPMQQSARWQEHVDTYFFSHGPCCAGCDWWRSLSPLVGNCLQSKIISGTERASMLGIDGLSLPIGAGHAVTPREYVCGKFEDTFDWSILPLPYRLRVGDPNARSRRPETT